MSNLSWLNPTPHAIAVYASQLLSPAVTQHSLPSGRAFALRKSSAAHVSVGSRTAQSAYSALSPLYPSLRTLGPRHQRCRNAPACFQLVFSGVLFGCCLAVELKPFFSGGRTFGTTATGRPSRIARACSGEPFTAVYECTRLGAASFSSRSSRVILLREPHASPSTFCSSFSSRCSISALSHQSWFA
jgi:hypothetical protein